MCDPINHACAADVCIPNNLFTALYVGQPLSLRPGYSSCSMSYYTFPFLSSLSVQQCLKQHVGVPVNVNVTTLNPRGCGEWEGKEAIVISE